MLAGLLNLDFSTPERTSFWVANNIDQHRLISSKVLTKYNTILDIYPINELTEEDWESWFQNHQQMHNDFNSVLGTPGNDFSSLDLKDPSQVALWTQLHFEEHRQAAYMLGIE